MLRKASQEEGIVKHRIYQALRFQSSRGKDHPKQLRVSSKNDACSARKMSCISPEATALLTLLRVTITAAITLTTTITLKITIITIITIITTITTIIIIIILATNATVVHISQRILLHLTVITEIEKQESHRLDVSKRE